MCTCISVHVCVCVCVSVSVCVYMSDLIKILLLKFKSYPFRHAKELITIARKESIFISAIGLDFLNSKTFAAIFYHTNLIFITREHCMNELTRVNSHSRKQLHSPKSPKSPCTLNKHRYPLSIINPNFIVSLNTTDSPNVSGITNSSKKIAIKV